jgi:hypothetical protein
VWLTSVLLGAPGGEGGEAGHEEVKAREGNHVDRQLTQVSVQLPREPSHSNNAQLGIGSRARTDAAIRQS